MATFNYYTYTRDDGTTAYSTKVRSDIVGVAALGWGAPASTAPKKPAGFRLRVVYARDRTTGRRRALPVATQAAYRTLTPDTGGQVVALADIGATGTVDWSVEGGRPEGFRRGVPHAI